ncbi:MAG: acetate kinase [Coriobacteriales bacterium]|jgi:acetate kinase|nr:acetate kinase [Coriobacteriales bacterium]
MNILVLNAGSSSLKYQLINMETEQVVAKGLCERVGASESVHIYEAGSDEREFVLELHDHYAAVKAVLETLTNPDDGVIKNLADITAIGHRVVHGGDFFAESVIITKEVIDRIKECVPLAPLHNPPALSGIRSCLELMPNTQQVAVFDTAFHQTMPPKAYRYPLPTEYYEKHRIRRYGFHGTSHRYVSERAAVMLNKPAEDVKVITCHLGNGCSLTAVKGGHSVDTSMGYTPLDGLMMGTRSGSIDPAILLYLIDYLDMNPREVNHIINKESGLLGVSGLSNDLRDVGNAADAGDERARLALELYAYSARRFLGSYFFALQGADAIVFTAGVGENAQKMREMILEGLEDLGICLDLERNSKRGGERFISTDDSPVKVMVIPTNEELMIAKDVKALIS